jgi:hypothetical protein
MRFMMIMIPEVYSKPIAPDFMPDMEAVKKMGEYNEALQQAGVLLALDGLTPPSAGARVSFAGGKAKVMDGPFPGSKEAVGGYWMIRVKSRDEAIEWAKRCPAGANDVIEIRQVTSRKIPDRKSRTRSASWRKSLAATGSAAVEQAVGVSAAAYRPTTLAEASAVCAGGAAAARV